MTSEVTHDALQADLEAALDAEAAEKNYHIRQALQRLVNQGEESAEHG